MTFAPEPPSIDRPEPTAATGHLTEVLYAIALFIACGLVVAGATILHPSAGFITGGLLLAGWSYLVLAE